jgi:hypothetical protein
MTGCVKQTTKKYKTRPSPPYPANKCRNTTKKGNYGNFYKSVSDKKGVYKWTRLNKTRKALIQRKRNKLLQK